MKTTMEAEREADAILGRRISDQQRTIDELVAALEKIQRRAAPMRFSLDGDVTLDDLRRDMRHVHAVADAALAKARKGGRDE